MARARRSFTACSRPIGVAEQRTAGDEHVGAGRGRRGDGVGADAAVDLDVDVVVAPGSREHRGDLGDLRLHRGDVLLAAEARVDGHHQHQVDQVEHVGDGDRRAWPGSAPRPAVAPSDAMLPSVRCRCVHASAWTIRRSQPASTYSAAITSGVSTIRWASNGSDVCRRAAAMTSGPNVRFGHELAVHDVPLDAVDAGRLERGDSSPSLAKSAGSTLGAISIGRVITSEGGSGTR